LSWSILFLVVALDHRHWQTEALKDVSTGGRVGVPTYLPDMKDKAQNASEFISEDEQSSFEEWLRSQGVDAATLTPEDLENWRSLFDEARERSAATPKVGLMKLRPLVPGEHRYAVAVRDGSDLWLTLWVKRSPKPEFFVFIPRGDRGWDPHASYHLDGTLHQKSFDQKFVSQKRQPLTGAFRGTAHLGAYMGHDPKGVGAICDLTAFSGVVEVAPGVLGPRRGSVIVDLVQPGCQPMPCNNVIQHEVFRDSLPQVVIRITS
jgi:hypothetical protein